MADNRELAEALTTADILNRMPQPSFWEKYIQPWGSASLAQQEPNWFGKNVLGNPDLAPVVAAINFSAPSPKVPVPMRARLAGFDTPAFHATGREFNEFKPAPYRGASFFARAPEYAIKGATAGANDFTGTGTSRMMQVLLPSEEILGLALTPAEKAWFKTLPERPTEAEVSNVLKGAPTNNFDYWWRLYDEHRLPNDQFAYTKVPMPKLDWETAAITGRDVYGRQHPHYGKGSEAFSSEHAKKHGMSGFLQEDEAGLTIGMVDPTRIRLPNAGFDPAKINSPNLLASGIGTAALIKALLGQAESDQQ